MTKAKTKKMILCRAVPHKFDGKKWTYITDRFEVTVMAVVSGYAMVRRKGAMPFVVGEKELHDA